MWCSTQTSGAGTLSLARLVEIFVGCLPYDLGCGYASNCRILLVHVSKDMWIWQSIHGV